MAEENHSPTNVHPLPVDNPLYRQAAIRNAAPRPEPSQPDWPSLTLFLVLSVAIGVLAAAAVGFGAIACFGVFPVASGCMSLVAALVLVLTCQLQGRIYRHLLDHTA